MFLIGPLNVLLATTQVQAADTDGAVGGLEEVVVSAQRRSESLQSVPLSITAMSSEDIARMNFQDAGDVASQVPNVIFTGGQVPNFALRGITLLTGSDNNETPVAFYRDDVYRATYSAQVAQLYDIERVEVLRGPQGTLFGRNATGGLVHFITKRPTDTFEAFGELQLGSYGQRIIEGAISGPLSERVRGRLSFKYNEDDGWQKAYRDAAGTDSMRVDKTDIVGVRAQLEADLTDSATFLLILEGAEQNNRTGFASSRGLRDPATGAICSDARVFANECVDRTGWSDPAIDPKRIYTSVRDPAYELEVYSATAKLEWRFDAFDLTSITAYENIPNRLRTDEGLGGPLWNPSFTYVWELEAEQFTQEIRLNGTVGDVDWIAGAFFFDDKKEGYTAFPFAAAALGTYGLQDYWAQDARSWAVFGQADWKLADTVTLTGGVRYTDEDKSLDATDDLDNPTFEAHETFSKGRVTARAALEWAPSDAVMYYGSVTTGYKSGGFNAELVTLGATAPVNEELITSYEVGLKSRLWDNRLSVNLSGYYYDYQDIQAFALVENPVTGTFATRLINVGDAGLYGFEAEVTAQLTQNFEARLALGLAEGEYEADADITVNGEPLDGNRPPRMPKVNVNGYLRYTIPADSLGSFAVQSDFNWRDEVEAAVANVPRDRMPSVGLVNFRATWNSIDERLYGSVFVENAFDKRNATSISSLESFGLQRIFWGTPRWYGVKAGVRF